jgi:hypothetical protein
MKSAITLMDSVNGFNTLFCVYTLQRMDAYFYFKIKEKREKINLLKWIFDVVLWIRNCRIFFPTILLCDKNENNDNAGID